MSSDLEYLFGIKEAADDFEFAHKSREDLFRKLDDQLHKRYDNDPKLDEYEEALSYICGYTDNPSHVLHMQDPVAFLHNERFEHLYQLLLKNDKAYLTPYLAELNAKRSAWLNDKLVDAFNNYDEDTSTTIAFDLLMLANSNKLDSETPNNPFSFVKDMRMNVIYKELGFDRELQDTFSSLRDDLKKEFTDICFSRIFRILDTEKRQDVLSKTLRMFKSNRRNLNVYISALIKAGFNNLAETLKTIENPLELNSQEEYDFFYNLNANASGIDHNALRALFLVLNDEKREAIASMSPTIAKELLEKTLSKNLSYVDLNVLLGYQKMFNIFNKLEFDEIDLFLQNKAFRDEFLRELPLHEASVDKEKAKADAEAKRQKKAELDDREKKLQDRLKQAGQDFRDERAKSFEPAEDPTKATDDNSNLHRIKKINAEIGGFKKFYYDELDLANKGNEESSLIIDRINKTNPEEIIRLCKLGFAADGLDRFILLRPEFTKEQLIVLNKIPEDYRRDYIKLYQDKRDEVVKCYKDQLSINTLYNNENSSINFVDRYFQLLHSNSKNNELLAQRYSAMSDDNKIKLEKIIKDNNKSQNIFNEISRFIMMIPSDRENFEFKDFDTSKIKQKSTVYNTTPAKNDNLDRLFDLAKDKNKLTDIVNKSNSKEAAELLNDGSEYEAFDTAFKAITKKQMSYNEAEPIIKLAESDAFVDLARALLCLIASNDMARTFVMSVKFTNHDIYNQLLDKDSDTINNILDKNAEKFKQTHQDKLETEIPNLEQLLSVAKASDKFSDIFKATGNTEGFEPYIKRGEDLIALRFAIKSLYKKYEPHTMSIIIDLLRQGSKGDIKRALIALICDDESLIQQLFERTTDKEVSNLLKLSKEEIKKYLSDKLNAFVQSQKNYEFLNDITGFANAIKKAEKLKDFAALDKEGNIQKALEQDNESSLEEAIRLTLKNIFDNASQKESLEIKDLISQKDYYKALLYLLLPEEVKAKLNILSNSDCEKLSLLSIPDIITNLNDSDFMFKETLGKGSANTLAYTIKDFDLQDDLFSGVKDKDIEDALSSNDLNKATILLVKSKFKDMPEQIINLFKHALSSDSKDASKKALLYLMCSDVKEITDINSLDVSQISTILNTPVKAMKNKFIDTLAAFKNNKKNAELLLNAMLNAIEDAKILTDESVRDQLNDEVLNLKNLSNESTTQNDIDIFKTTCQVSLNKLNELINFGYKKKDNKTYEKLNIISKVLTEIIQQYVPNGIDLSNTLKEKLSSLELLIDITSNEKADNKDINDKLSDISNFLDEIKNDISTEINTTIKSNESVFDPNMSPSVIKDSLHGLNVSIDLVLKDISAQKEISKDMLNKISDSAKFIKQALHIQAFKQKEMMDTKESSISSEYLDDACELATSGISANSADYLKSTINSNNKLIQDIDNGLFDETGLQLLKIFADMKSYNSEIIEYCNTAKEILIKGATFEKGGRLLGFNDVLKYANSRQTFYKLANDFKSKDYSVYGDFNEDFTELLSHLKIASFFKTLFLRLTDKSDQALRDSAEAFSLIFETEDSAGKTEAFSSFRTLLKDKVISYCSA